jgi:hypothetical protein
MGLFFADGSDFVNVIRFWRARFIQKLVNGAARCAFYYMTCVIYYDGFVGFKCVLEIIMFEYDTGKLFMS